jgi:hypothetical protein
MKACTDGEKYGADDPWRCLAGYQTRTGIARGPPVRGSNRPRSSTNVDRAPTLWLPVGRGIDSPNPVEPTDAPRPVPAIVSDVF